jgi:transmembrane protein EpsG
MYETISVGLIAILLAYLTKYGNFQYGLEYSFAIIFIFLAIRHNFGNDYISYYYNFNEITNSNIINYDIGTIERIIEPGWVLFNRLFTNLGFNMLIAFHSLVFCLGYYYLFKKYVMKEYYWLSVLIFIFDPAFMLIQLSALRQALATIVIIYSYQYIYQKNIFKFIFVITIASLFHTSAILFYPVYFLSLQKIEINKVSVGIFILVVSYMFLYDVQIYPIISSLAENRYMNYSRYINETDINIGSGLGQIYNTMLLIFTLYMGAYRSDITRLFFMLSVLSLLISPLSLVINMLDRVNYYFQPAILVTIPIIVDRIKSKHLRYSLLLLIIVFSFRSYYNFINNEIWIRGYMVYQTIFSIN